MLVARSYFKLKFVCRKDLNVLVLEVQAKKREIPAVQVQVMLRHSKAVEKFPVPPYDGRACDVILPSSGPAFEAQTDKSDVRCQKGLN